MRTACIIDGWSFGNPLVTISLPYFTLSHGSVERGWSHVVGDVRGQRNRICQFADMAGEPMSLESGSACFLFRPGSARKHKVPASGSYPAVYEEIRQIQIGGGEV